MDDAILPGETWLPVIDYEGAYEVSDHVRARSLPRTILRSDGRTQNIRGRILRQSIAVCGGYPVVALARNGFGRPHYLHQLVAEAFLGPRPPGQVVCHVNGNPLDCRPENLVYATQSQNMYDKTRHGTNHMGLRTVCPYKHPLVLPNLVASRLPHRICLACTRARAVIQQKGGDHQMVSDRKLAELMQGP